jgi:hypothetical protein
MLVGTADENRTLSIPRFRGEDNFKKDIKDEAMMRIGSGKCLTEC